MKNNTRPETVVIIPAFNEEASIGKVVRAIPKTVTEIIVTNNDSTDQTALVAKTAGATVLLEEKKGYGYACLRGIDYLNQKEKKPDIVVFLDGDYSDHPEELPLIINPILQGEVDVVIGARVPEKREKGAMTPQQIFGNWLASSLMKLRYRSSFTDLGPFRAIRWETLQQLKMSDKTYGWTIEMQLKVLRFNIPYREVAVSYKRRIGVSKVSGTVKGTIFASVKIIGWILKHFFI